MAFLKYLQYWKQPEYVRYIQYPHSLGFLDILCDDENDTFRSSLKDAAFRDFIHSQHFLHWQHYAGQRTNPIADEHEA
eukprot:scaffold2141_cov282-Pinguiococcus_pyrenoidosus.AAC.12